jgi:spore photoproduct lyase
MRRVAQAGYPVGVTLVPIMPVPGWREAYDAVLTQVAAALAKVSALDLSVELITHSFSPGSKAVQNGWHKGSSLEMDEAARSRKTTKFGYTKFVFPPELMREMRTFFGQAIARQLPSARNLYWT